MDTEFADDAGHQIPVEFQPESLPVRLFKKVVSVTR